MAAILERVQQALEDGWLIRNATRFKKLRASAKREVSPTPSVVIEPGRLGVTAMRSSLESRTGPYDAIFGLYGRRPSK